MASLNEGLQAVVGEKLSSVTFVMDYWQLDFDGNLLTVLTRLSVCLDGVATDSGAPPFRNLLCERIGKHVERVEFDTDLLSISFDDNSSITVFARASDYVGPEALTFRSAKSGELYVV